MNRNLVVSKETQDRVKLAKKYVENRYTKLLDHEQKKMPNWDKILNTMRHESKQYSSFKNIRPEAYSQIPVKRLLRQKDSLHNYELLNVIGRGAFGQVRLGRDKIKGQLVAIKRLYKQRLLDKKQIYNAYLERDFLVDSQCDFLIKIKSAFQDESYLYIVMEYAAGGDLLHLLIQRDIFSEQQTRFYLAQMVAAVEQIHKMNYIHRDIKPDNILLTSEGHVKISDFGLSKFLQCKNQNSVLSKIDKLHRHMNLKNRESKVFSKVGTPDYISPEVLTQQIYDHAVDIWALGIFMFECLFGYPPFSDDEPKQVCYKVIFWEQYFMIPQNPPISSNAKSLLQGMITNKQERLTISQIKNHPFFHGINWNKLVQLEPPYVPKLDHEVDVQNFDKFDIQIPWTDQQNRKQCHYRKKTQSLQSHFKFPGFQYREIDHELLQYLRDEAKKKNQTSKKTTHRSIKHLFSKKRLKTQQSTRKQLSTPLKSTISFLKTSQKISLKYRKEKNKQKMLGNNKQKPKKRYKQKDLKKQIDL